MDITISPTEKVNFIVWIDDEFFTEKEIFEMEVEEELRLGLSEGITIVTSEFLRTWYPPHRISKVVLRKN
jgi:hypothetical protein